MTTPEDTEWEINRLQESSDFWRVRANTFEEALRRIRGLVEHDAVIRAERQWEIADDILSLKPQTEGD